MSRNSSHTEAKKKAKNKDVFSRQRLTHCWSHLDRTWGNDHSKHSKWRWSARTAVTAEDKVTFHSWLAETGMTLLVSRDIFTAALLTARNGGSVELKAVGVYFNISISAECQKIWVPIYLSTFSVLKNFFGLFETDSTDWTEHVDVSYRNSCLDNFYRYALKTLSTRYVTASRLQSETWSVCPGDGLGCPHQNTSKLTGVHSDGEAFVFKQLHNDAKILTGVIFGWRCN